MGRGIIILLATVPLGFVLWLLWRRTRLPADEERRPAATGSSADKSTATVEIEHTHACPAEVQPRDEKEEESGRDIEGPEREEPTLPPAAAATQSESTESDGSGKREGAEPVADSETQEHEELSSAKSAPGPLQACIETSLEYNEPTVDI